MSKAGEGRENGGENGEPDWSDADWRPLLTAIQAKKCTPFLGAGACAGVLPLGGEIARNWAQSGYPFDDAWNLPRVAQFRAVHEGSLTAKLELQQEFARRGQPDFNDEHEPHRVITDLRLPLYITTNYDQFIVRAIEAANQRDPQRQRQPKSVICPWHLTGRPRRSNALPSAVPIHGTPEAPLVFHLHGRIDQHESMVLTEDDYLDFLMYISEDLELIPPPVEEAFSNSSLLFLGYSLDDMNFKVIFRKLATYMRRAEGARHVSVQLAPRRDEAGRISQRAIDEQRRYLEEHYKLQHVKVYWGSCRQFVTSLRGKLGAAP